MTSSAPSRPYEFSPIAYDRAAQHGLGGALMPVRQIDGFLVDSTTTSGDTKRRGNTDVGGSDPGFGRDRTCVLPPKTHSEAVASFGGRSRPREEF